MPEWTRKNWKKKLLLNSKRHKWMKVNVVFLLVASVNPRRLLIMSYRQEALMNQ
jgi:hypothetical protein